MEPFCDPNIVVRALPHLRTEVEITVPKGLAIQSCFDPIAIHPESSEKDTAVVPAQPTIEGAHALGTQGKENRVDELHDVVALEMTKGAPQSPEKGHCGAPIHAVTFQIHIAGVCFPPVAIGGQRDFVTECAQTFRQGGVDVGIVAEE